LKPLRAGRIYTDAELAAHALRAVEALVGRDPDTGKRRPYRSRAALAKAMGLTSSALSAALAPADRPESEYDRGASTRALLLRLLLGYEVQAVSTVERSPDRIMRHPDPPAD